MVKITSFIFLIFLFTGCAKTDIKYIDKPITVEVPIFQKAQIVRIKEPILPIKNLTNSSSPKEVAEAYYKSLLLYKKYSEKLRTVLESISEYKE